MEPKRPLSRGPANGRASPSKQRGIYSDFLKGLETPDEGPNLGQSPSAKKLPFAHNFKAVGLFEDDIKRRSDSEAKVAPTRVEPKVFLPHARQSGFPPRKIEVERKLRYFKAQNLEELLANEGIDYSQPCSVYDPNPNPSVTASFEKRLPLEAFDNKDFEVHAPSVWMAMGQTSEDGGVTGKALHVAGDGSGQWRGIVATEYNDDNEKWRVTWREGPLKGESAWLDRVHICFDAEDPFNFARRVAEAHAARRDAEALLRYNLYVDCMPVDDSPKLDSEQVSSIMTGVLSSKALEGAQSNAQGLLEEVNLDYARTMNKIIFDDNLARSGDAGLLASVRVPPAAQAPAPPASGVVAIPPHDIADTFSQFTFNSALTRPEVIAALMKIRAECNAVMDTRSKLLHTVPGKSLRLEEFEQTQSAAITAFSGMLEGSWSSSIRAIIRSSLRDVGKGWFNLGETKMELYQFSKLKRFLRAVNAMMQDSLKTATEDTLARYERYIMEACEGDVTVNSSADVSVVYPQKAVLEGRSRRPPLFQVDIAVGSSEEVVAEGAIDGKEDKEDKADKADKADKEGKEGKGEGGKQQSAREGQDNVGTDKEGGGTVVTKYHFEYSEDLDAFVEAPVTAVAKGLEALQGITQIEKLVMDKLFWSHTPVMATIHPQEGAVAAVQERLRAALSACTPAATAYLSCLNKFLPLLNTDVDAFLAEKKALMEGEFRLAELTALVAKHRAGREAVAAEVPRSVNLGLWTVNLADIRSRLMAKHAAIADGVLQLIASFSQAKCEATQGAVDGIMKALGKFPKNIEDLTELQDYIGSSVPDKLRELLAAINDAETCFGALEEYCWSLPRDLFWARWEAYGGPRRIHKRIGEVEEMLEAEKVRYLEEMEGEQKEFEEELDDLSADVDGLAAFTNMEQVSSAAAAVRKVKERLGRAMEKKDVFNRREGLFDKDVTEYTRLVEIGKAFEPYRLLWETVDAWLSGHNAWLTEPFLDIDPEAVAKAHSDAARNIHKSLKNFERLGIESCADIAATVKDQVEEFKPHIPLVQALRNPGMRERHWRELSDVTGVDVAPSDGFTLTSVFELGLQNYLDACVKIGERAGKEYQIELSLDKMEGEWQGIDLDIEPYRDTGTAILHGVDDLIALLDEHITMTQAMQFSAFKKPFEERIELWARKLNTVSEVLDEWIKVQLSWLYLQPIFDSADIQKQLPTEYKRFNTVDKNWRATMSRAKASGKAITFCADEKLLEKFQQSNKFLDLVQKGLSDYLETKRSGFARFYFLSNDELLEILSETKDPTRVQPHLKKCFEGIKRVRFSAAQDIEAMVSDKGEEIEFEEPIQPKGKNVEDWMTELEDKMRLSVQQEMYKAIADYPQRPRTEWVQQWVGMCVLNASQMYWTREIEEGMAAKGAKGVAKAFESQLKDLEDMVRLVRSPLSKLARITLGALTVLDVHARDVTRKLVEQKVGSARDFEWISQMRYYWEAPEGVDIADGDMWVMMVSSKRPYGYEYIGNEMRLVITPLTDKCYMTLMGALQMNLGGAPAGPAGTGKTETVKDLAKALAKQCVVFNCSDGLDYLAMGKFFKGLASCGAWACFDEFNRIDVEVLSVVAQQILTLQNGVTQGMERIMFEGSDIVLNGQFAVYITMNPGYAGRTELPDNLKALFRPVAMMVPDYALIGEIMLFSFGFEKALSCAKKMVATFRLCSEQLSSQDHYDYGMRAVKTVITAAGNLKRQDPDMDEEILLLRALQDVNLPKFLAHDLPLFNGIMSDLFPGLSRPHIDYGDLMTALTLSTEDAGLQPVTSFLTKCIQLYETIVVRHGLMVVGPTGGGKSRIISVLKAALTRLHAAGIEGNKFQRVVTHIMNPKSITMGQLYGEFDKNTHEWNDGILAYIVRKCASDASATLKWVIFDGPVDALWIENMNTVLDDNKKLCLVSGEIIALTPEMEIMFEVEDLAVASPATVSRCGMVYMEPTSLGFDPIIRSWVERLPPALPAAMKTALFSLLDTYLRPALVFLRRYLSEPVPTVDNQLLQGLLNILDCYFEPFIEKEGEDPPSAEAIEAAAAQLPARFMFALVWSVAATSNRDGRARFDGFLRAEMASNGFSHPFPAGGYVYDYAFDAESGAWVPWMSTVPEYVYDSKASFSELIIPTKDSVRYKYLGRLLLSNRFNVLMTGPTGTGKTVNMSQLLSSDMPGNYVPITITFSAQTSANQTQDMIDSKLDKRSRGVYGPTAGSMYVLFVDDLNMPQRETYFAQPPIELLRQWCDYSGWYDRKERTFRRVVDTILLGAMGPPGGGRNPVTPRMIRHFNVVNYTEMDDESMFLIFNTILSNFLSTFDAAVHPYAPKIVHAAIGVYNTIVAELLPTPAKPHYTYNLRDLGAVFQGMLMASPKRTPAVADVLRLWVHETRRVFEDRLVSDEDRSWFEALLAKQLRSNCGEDWDAIMPADVRLLFGDFMVPGADPRVYEEVKDMAALQPTVEEYLSDYNAESKTPMKLVMFLDAIEHVARISRIIRQQNGNALLLGVGGSGRQSLTRLAAAIGDYALHQIEISKGYGKAEWREDVKTILMRAGVDNVPVVFLFSDTQIVFEGMLEDVNNVLNAGDVPNLYAAEDLEVIMDKCKAECLKRRLPPTRINIMAQYIARVRQNIHVVICMSPMGEKFRERLRMFPSLVNCCTIDWFSEWPAEALRSVATSAMTEQDLALGEYLDGCVEFFRMVHTSVADASREYYDTLRRYNYVTPTSYLELLSTFKTVLEQKRAEVGGLRNRLQNGLEKLVSTADNVAQLQEELRDMEPKLVEMQKEADEMIVEIDKDKEEAAKTKEKVAKEEQEAQAMAKETRAIADDAQRDLDEALPALDEAVAILNKLKKSDIDEVRSMKKPPAGVRLTMHAACVMFEVRPIEKPDPDNVGKKIKDYWDAAQKALLSDGNKFLSDLKTFDKENIKEKVITAIQPFMEAPEFEPKAVEKSSKACSGICMWVRAMYKYYHVAKEVEPKKQRLKEAQATLDKTLAELDEAKARLKAVEDRIDTLEKKFNDTQARKEQLAKDVEQCRARLARSLKLIGGLGGEKDRWADTVARLNVDYENLIGDALVSSSTIAYLGPFTSDFRARLVGMWQAELEARRLPHSRGCDVHVTLADPVQVRAWTIAGLPSDRHSVENGIIMAKARRWPLLIDPQGQANRYIKNMGKDKALAMNGMDVVRENDKKFLQNLENGVRFGKWILLENIGEQLDAALEPLLLQQKFKQGGAEMIKLGDSIIPYNDSFRFFMTTKLPNPHYPPEVAVKVSLLNFTITPKGLEDQMLGVFVVNELPELEERKNTLTLSMAAMKKELQDLENKILYLLSNSEGNILDDEVLIDTLAQSKTKSVDITAKVEEAEVTEKEIDSLREKYRPVAYRASILYFCITDLSGVDPMYQYSLQWFRGLFENGIRDSEKAEEVEARIANLNSYFTYLMYRNVCRSLFERHKLLFSFLMTIRIMQGDDAIDPAEWRYLISGQSDTKPEEAPRPADAPWLNERSWSELQTLDTLPAFSGLCADVRDNVAAYKRVFDSSEAESAPLPAKWSSCTMLQHMCLLRALRPDVITLAIQAFVSGNLGKRFIEPPPFDLSSCFGDSNVTTPLIFVLSTGSDPTRAFYAFADAVGMRSKVNAISLGQGQGAIAAALIAEAQQTGQWVLLQNCHLAASWMPDLERICEAIDPEQVNKDFRLWLTSMPSKHFPVSVLQNGVKMTNEPPKGLRQNINNFYYQQNDDTLSVTDKPDCFRKLLFGLAFFHANVQERKKFGPLGWNIPYEFNDSDLDISKRQLEMFLNEYTEIPYKVLNFMTSYINYGGRVTDDKDLRLIDSILRDYFCPDVMQEGYKFSASGIYRTIQASEDGPHDEYMKYIADLPFNAGPEVFGLHANATIASDQAETYATFDTLLSLQPRSASGGGKSREEIIAETAGDIAARLPAEFDVESISMMYPVKYEESMNTVLVQECLRYNRLLKVMKPSLRDIQKALKGLVVMSGDLEAMGTSLSTQKVPEMWEAKAYPSLKPLGAWVTELLDRLHFIRDWVDNGIPPCFWISGFFFPQAFLTGTLQNYARKYQLPIDTLEFSFHVKDTMGEDITEKPDDGCYIRGLFLEGARWDMKKKVLADSKPKELYTQLPMLHLLPEKDRTLPQEKVYRCPVYKILSRRGTLSTTGHSTNFVMFIELPSDRATALNLTGEPDCPTWIKAGVAAFCSLRYQSRKTAEGNHTQPLSSTPSIGINPHRPALCMQ